MLNMEYKFIIKYKRDNKAFDKLSSCFQYFHNKKVVYLSHFHFFFPYFYLLQSYYSLNEPVDLIISILCLKSTIPLLTLFLKNFF